MNAALKKLTTVALCLAFGVILLGAYTRLTDAGLGCPDWPGCYGKLLVAKSVPLHDLHDMTKAWTEMVHRYFAGTLGLLIVCIAVLAYRIKTIRSTIPYALLALVFFQAALGMWTVTLKLLPVVVMGHLLGGMLIFGGLVYFRWQLSFKHQPICTATPLLNIGVLIVFLQIALGGWVSSNYAALACVGFPTCNGTWLPALDFNHAFQFVLPTHLNYQGGLLESTARVTIQMMHRLGAVITLSYLIFLFSHLYRQTTAQHSLLRRMILLSFILVLLQLTLGILNVVYLLPLTIAVLHNGVAAGLFACMLSLRYLARRHA